MSQIPPEQAALDLVKMEQARANLSYMVNFRISSTAGIPLLFLFNSCNCFIQNASCEHFYSSKILNWCCRLGWLNKLS